MNVKKKKACSSYLFAIQNDAAAGENSVLYIINKWDSTFATGGTLQLHKCIMLQTVQYKVFAISNAFRLLERLLLWCIFLPGGRLDFPKPEGIGSVSLPKKPPRASLSGLLTVGQNEREWIISNTAKSNLTYLSFPSPGSHLALMQERKESREVRGMKKGRRGKEMVKH